MNVTLLIFTCEGKEHLLPSCFDSFKKAFDYKFSKTILALDGPIDPQVIQHINPDTVVQNHIRKGYIYSIINAISLVETDYFFWLEDDFDFQKKTDLNFLLNNLSKNNAWSGIFLSRTAPLTDEEKQKHHCGDFYQPHFGFSVSPTLCRTAIIKAAFESLKNEPKNESTKLVGFETYISNYFLSHNYSFALLDPGTKPDVIHAGQLESTAREYHMINSLDASVSDVGKEYISGLGYDRAINFKNKLSVIGKLWLAFLRLSFDVFKARKYYDQAFRTYLSVKNLYKVK